MQNSCYKIKKLYYIIVINLKSRVEKTDFVILIFSAEA